jgi:hypothetical protein
VNPGDAVAVIGAGSLRAAGTIIGSLFCTEWSGSGELRLYDCHDEALDLFDRLARVFAAEADSQVRITATTRMAEATRDANVVILGFGLGPHKEEWLQWVERTGCDPAGDAATAARAVLLNRVMSEVGDLIHLHSQAPFVINLVRPVALSARLFPGRAVHVDAPAQLGDEERIPAAHRALRWVKGDEYPGLILKSMEDSPVLRALRGEINPENRFDAKAVRQWAEEIEASFPGASATLLNLPKEA